MNIKLLYVCDGLRAGGKERQLSEIIKNIDKQKFELGIITFNKNGHFSELIKKYVSFYKELSKRPTRLEPFFTIWKVFQDFKPDIVHTWDSLSSLYSYLPTRIFKSKLIDGSIRDAGIEKGWQLYLKRFFLKRADLVISNSYAGLKNYSVVGDVMYNAIDMNRFKPKIENGEFNIIMVANFTDYKDHQTFINASVALLYESIVDNVFLAGDGPHKQKFSDYIASKHNSLLKRFHFLGTIKNVEDYLTKCKVGVLCSTSKFGEGISNSVLEYMATGLVPVATNLGGTSEIIEDRINGFLFQEGRSDQLFAIVKKIKEEYLYDKLNFYSQFTIESKFSLSKNLSNLQKAYLQINGLPNE